MGDRVIAHLVARVAVAVTLAALAAAATTVSPNTC